ncbi:NADPH:quinone oxidoreductase family protein [Mesorhizobium australafricanum]|uniref:NADPH:quinone oxidoreductase family protein n=1 Tax=Mesorhizobium australafricanum TaxID=3072311 RepID=A0ABU4X870_9HYPH|nr:NADPH:quinone oxidoreductase family protein [Mesorhizobium sp. VK3E]MDX8443347.1 NADPH:quinone oxidoreductase family protein [Mesorhizobium sp. VK3E]
MRAIVCSELGPPERLKLETLSDVLPGPGQVLVAVEAAGVNFPDTLIIEGKYQIKPEVPFSPGGELSGVVKCVGADVEGFAPGDPVMAMTAYGAFREEVVVNASVLMKRPTSMDAVVAAGFTMTYGTSMHALKQRAGLRPGETLLVLGAGGGVGLAAVEIGKAIGARVIAAASSAEKLAAARAAGADELVNYSEQSLKDRVKELTGGSGADVVYDPVGGELFEQALRATAWEGRVLVVGFASGMIPKPPVNLALLKGCSIVGVFFGGFHARQPDDNRRNFDELFEFHKAGLLKPLIDHTMPLERAAEALRLVSERKVIGKIVLLMGNAER